MLRLGLWIELFSYCANHSSHCKQSGSKSVRPLADETVQLYRQSLRLFVVGLSVSVAVVLSQELAFELQYRTEDI
jgi:hypothetical protein